MSLYIDLKFINMISFKLERFQKKGDYLFNFRCCYCGDSQTKKNKARGYIYRKNNDMFYRCHNCNHGTTFGKMLEHIDPLLSKDYVVEKFIKKDESKKEEDRISPYEFNSRPIFNKPLSLIDGLMDKLDTLPEDHEAVRYVKSRGIPEKKFSKMYYVEDVKNLTHLNIKYEEAFEKMSSHPRLALPLVRDGQLLGLCLRAIRGEKLRYINLNIKDELQVYGMDEIDQEQEVYIVEGPIDSLFLDNSIACVGTSFGKVDKLRLTHFTMIFDNQPRNKEVCDIIEKQIQAGNKVCLWPDIIEEKDINDMILSGLSKENIMKIIEDNTYQGLEAELQFSEWRKC